MTDVEHLVERHYGIGGILDRITAALKQAGVDPKRLSYSDLHPFDQLHGRGLTATREHAERAGIRGDMHVLDIGCGLGGSARYLAATTGCRVTGVDLTREYVDVARELTRRCELSVKIDYHQADALALPFDDKTFDHVWCHNVTMNIADKQSLAREVARVLKRGGRFSCSEIGKGPIGEPHYPMPWARDSSASFLVTPVEMRMILEGAGLRMVDEIDLTEIFKAAAREIEKRAERGEPPPPQTLHVVLGEDLSARVRNSSSGLTSGALVETFFLVTKV